MVQRNRQLTVCRCQKVKTVYRGGDGMNKLYDLLKYIIYASFYVIAFTELKNTNFFADDSRKKSNIF